jgi:hypothetical protein
MGNRLQRFMQLHLGLYASSPRIAAGYFAAIPLLLNIRTLLYICNTICEHGTTKFKQIKWI